MKYFQVTCTNHAFVASYVKHDSNWYEIRHGGTQKKCIIIHIYPRDKYCTLIDAFHDKECNINGDLPPKNGTVEMIHAGIVLCKNLHPKLKYMSIQDESVIKCGNGKQLPLGDVYMLLYGQTWYQKYLHATPVQISDCVSHLSRILHKPPKMKWDDLWDTYLRLGFNDDQKVLVQQKYSTAQTWHEFFQSIRENNCVTWCDWIGLLTKTLARGTTMTGSIWHIDISSGSIWTCFTITEVDKPPVKPSRPTYIVRRLFGGRNRK